MRFSHLAVLALSGLSLASPVVPEKRADNSVEALLTDLYATVQIYTGAINATLAPLTPSSPLVEKTAAIAQVGAQINKMTLAVQSTADEVKDLAPANATAPASGEKRSTTSSVQVEPKKTVKRQLIAISALLSLIIVEIFATVAAAVAILGLAGLLVYLNPLTGALSALILAVQLVLNVVLIGVIALLNGLLTSLALGVSGL